MFICPTSVRESSCCGGDLSNLFFLYSFFCIHLFKFMYCLFVQQCVRVPVVEETCPTEVCFDILVDSLKQVNSLERRKMCHEKQN